MPGIFKELEMLSSGTSAKDEYRVVRNIKKGCYGKVCLAVHKPTGIRRALKTVHWRGDANKREKAKTILSEIKVMREVKSPNVVSLKGCFYDPKRYEVTLAMELMSGGNLLDLTRYEDTKAMLNVEVQAWVLVEVLKGLHWLHSKDIIHRDVKSENVLLTMHGDVKLGDLGMAALPDSPDRHQVMGNPLWASPEMVEKLEDDDHERVITTKTDIWAVGLLPVEMHMGYLPLFPPNHKAQADDFYLMEDILAKTVRAEVDGRMVEFCKMCTQVDPQDRPTARDLLMYPLFLEPELPNAKELVEVLKVARKKTSSALYNIVHG